MVSCYLSILPRYTALAALLDILAGGSGMVFGKAIEHLAIIATLITLFLPAFMEELGWLGYALDRLQSRWSALIFSAILGILWAFWDTPLFFFRDSIQYNMGFGSLSFWTFIADVVFMTVIMTWIFNNTHRSTLSAILWHTIVNGTRGFFTLAKQADNYPIVLLFIAATVIAKVWRAKAIAGQDTTMRPLYQQTLAKQ